MGKSEALRFLKKHASYLGNRPVIKETQRLESYKDELSQMFDDGIGDCHCRLSGPGGKAAPVSSHHGST